MEDNRDSLLDMIPQPSHTFFYFRGCWANGKEGSITDSSGHGVYRFFPLTKDADGNRIDAEIDFDDYVANPVVATGIIGYWLHYHKNNNCLASYTTWTKDKERKNTLKIFNDYTKDKLEQYVEREDISPSGWRRDLEKEFYTNFIIPNEKRLIKQSEALLEYITPEDQQLVRDVMKEYILYLQQIRDTYQPPNPKSSTDKTLKIESILKPDRVVDIEKIRDKFKNDFDKRTYIPMLKNYLEQPQSDKELARVALLIWNSQWFIRKDYKDIYINWYRDFCKHVKCDFHKDYYPSALIISKKTRDKYYFL